MTILLGVHAIRNVTASALPIIWQVGCDQEHNFGVCPIAAARSILAIPHAAACMRFKHDTPAIQAYLALLDHVHGSIYGSGAESVQEFFGKTE
jgi:hypothetical protein